MTKCTTSLQTSGSTFPTDPTRLPIDTIYEISRNRPKEPQRNPDRAPLLFSPLSVHLLRNHGFTVLHYKLSPTNKTFMQEEYDTLDHRGYYALFLCSDNVFF